eukprot:4445808-Amphidinium_carterae.1
MANTHKQHRTSQSWHHIPGRERRATMRESNTSATSDSPIRQAKYAAPSAATETAGRCVGSGVCVLLIKTAAWNKFSEPGTA